MWARGPPEALALNKRIRGSEGKLGRRWRWWPRLGPFAHDLQVAALHPAYLSPNSAGEEKLEELIRPILRPLTLPGAASQRRAGWGGEERPGVETEGERPQRFLSLPFSLPELHGRDSSRPLPPQTLPKCRFGPQTPWETNSAQNQWRLQSTRNPTQFSPK